MVRLRRGQPVQMAPGGQATPDIVGIVQRTSQTGGWADVLWLQFSAFGVTSWRKRQPDASLLSPADAEQAARLSQYLDLFGPPAPGSLGQAFATQARPVA